MNPLPDSIDIGLILDLTGVFFFAMSGCLLAVRKGFDLVGSLVLGSLVGLGGGVIRDIILNQGPPAAFSNPVYLLPPLIATLLVYFMSSHVERLGSWLMLFDAGGLALFCIAGTVKALEYGMNPVSAALLGVTSAVGGGLLRDIAANEIPQLFDSRDIYAFPAFVGAALAAVVWTNDIYNLWTGMSIAVVVLSFRVLAWKFSWHAPLAVRGWIRQRRT